MSRTIWTLALLVGFVQLTMAHSGTALRRQISASQPAWIIHIDVWNTADPQKIIDMVPEDVRPYVIFNISTSSSDNLSPSGPAIYDSWMKVCAQNRVWTMIQCASGAYNRMPDDGSTAAYEQYFKDYPNFLGFNFAEQFWGFGEDGNATFDERLQLFADLMPVCHQSLIDEDAKQLTAIKKSQYQSRWSTIDAKVAELNALFPEEYSGDIFAGRMENAWVTYNPYQYDETVSDGYRVCSASTKRAQGSIPFQYNTCERVTLDYAPYSLGVMWNYNRGHSLLSWAIAGALSYDLTVSSWNRRLLQVCSLLCRWGVVMAYPWNTITCRDSAWRLPVRESVSSERATARR